MHIIGGVDCFFGERGRPHT